MANNVKITYGNRLIKALEDVGTATLYTRDKILTDDIVVDYTPELAVRFIDYDGTILHTYTAEEFNELSALPENPTHTGLTAQGWNWTLADAKTHVAKYGFLDIGQHYITSDGKTRLYVTLSEGRLHPSVGFGINGTAIIDWGDGSEPSTVTGSYISSIYYSDHEYAQEGDYVITIDGQIGINGNSSTSSLFVKGYIPSENQVYLNFITKIELGNIGQIGSAAFSYCRSLLTINIPQGLIVNLTGITPGYIFRDCFSLQSLTLPNTMSDTVSNGFSGCKSLQVISLPNTVRGFSQNSFYQCFNLQRIAIPDGTTIIDQSAFNSCYKLINIKIPNSVTSIRGSAFHNCSSLQSITIPDTVTSIGAGAFNSCYSLVSVDLPSSVTSIDSSVFRHCDNLKNINLDNITSIWNDAFAYCANLQYVNISHVQQLGARVFSDCVSLKSINISNDITSIDVNLFSGCNSLKDVNIPSNATNIPNYLFSNCYCLPTIIIPSGVTSIGSQAFSSCSGLGEIHFLPTTPPTVASSSAWSSIPTDCKIYVPTGTLSAYTTATNYPSSSTYTYVEE